MSNLPVDSSSPSPVVAFTNEDRSFLRTILREAAGIEIGADRDTLLTSRLTPIIRRHDLADIATLVRTLRIGNRQLENEVIEAMTTNETSFFRDPNVFEDLGSHLIPHLLERLPADQPLTIWSAASSSGQEAYSLAILFHELFPHLVQARRVRILATDLSQEMVDRTRDGGLHQAGGPSGAVRRAAGPVLRPGRQQLHGAGEPALDRAQPDPQPGPLAGGPCPSATSC